MVIILNGRSVLILKGAECAFFNTKHVTTRGIDAVLTDSVANDRYNSANPLAAFSIDAVVWVNLPVASANVPFGSANQPDVSACESTPFLNRTVFAAIAPVDSANPRVETATLFEYEPADDRNFSCADENRKSSKHPTSAQPLHPSFFQPQLTALLADSAQHS